MRPDEKRRYTKRTYKMAEVRLREIFKIPVNEMVVSFEYDKPNSKLILTTLKDCDIEQGDL
ncbi:MAG: hypothetical protein ACTSQY_09375 [Candidatus Odinarchaeia archaeon]